MTKGTCWERLLRNPTEIAMEDILYYLHQLTSHWQRQSGAMFVHGVAEYKTFTHITLWPDIPWFTDSPLKTKTIIHIFMILKLHSASLQLFLGSFVAFYFYILKCLDPTADHKCTLGFFVVRIEFVYKVSFKIKSDIRANNSAWAAGGSSSKILVNFEAHFMSIEA